MRIKIPRMNRRNFLRTGSFLVAGASLGLAQEASREEHAGWRTFEITTQVDVLSPSGATRVWVPTPFPADTSFQKNLGSRFECPTGSARQHLDHSQQFSCVAADFAESAKPRLTVISRVATRNWSVELSAPKRRSSLSSVSREDMEGTHYIPVDGVVKQRAMEITHAGQTDLEKARAIYEWIVLNTYRNPRVRGCGRGDIRFMLESGDLGGKCADLNALYVGLARAAGLPARDVYGVRVSRSQLGYKSLGTSSSDSTKAQHCRAEVHLNGYGWVPVDPADVRKVILEEPPGNLPVTDQKVSAARARLFGSWEMNWIAYNYAHDVRLPGSKFGPLAFFMYPQAETKEGRVDCLDPAGFRYTISSQEMTSALG